jgi:hypothetical protein
MACSRRGTDDLAAHHISDAFGPAQPTTAASISESRAEYAVFSCLAASQRNMCPVQTIPAVVGIGKGQGSGEVVSQLVNVAFSTRAGRKD